MANGVNVKMGVSGVAQFKNNMNQAKQTVKTLDAQLALTEKQFKASGDSQEYMAKKAAELQAKLEAQKSVVENAEKALQQMAANGVDTSSTAYQGLYQQMLKAKGEMLDTENAMRGVETASDDAAEGAKGMNDQLAQIGRGIDWQNVESGLSSITSGMGNVIKRAWQMGEAIVKNTLGAGSWADELATTATQYKDTLEMFGGGSSTTETLQRMRKTASLIDTDVDVILDAQDKLTKNIEKQDKEGMGALAELKIDPNAKSSIDVFWEAGEAIAKLSNEETRISYAQKLFGKGWRELLPLFIAGREEYDKTMASWSVVSDDQLESLGKMDDQYQKLTGEWETFKMEILGTFSGPLTAGMEKLTGFVQELNKYLETPEGQAMIKQMGDTITQLIEDLTNVNPEDVVNGLKGVVDGVTSALQWIQQHSGEVVTGVEAFVGAWGTLKVTEGITTVLKLVNGISGLTASGAASAGASVGTSWASAFASAALKAAPWLVGLVTLLNPSAGGDKIGDNTLFDENGNPTKEAEYYGITSETGTQHAMEHEIPGLAEKIVEDKMNTQYTGDTEEAIDRNQRRLRSNHGFDELTTAAEKMEEAANDLTGGSNAAATANSEMAEATTSLKGIPALMVQAVTSALSGLKIYLSGEEITAQVETAIAASVYRQ